MRADFLANITSEDVIIKLGGYMLRDLFFILNGMIGDAVSCIQKSWCNKGKGGACRDAFDT